MPELVELFEAERGRLRAVAYRLLGSVEAAEDAVQETWLRLARVDPGGVDNLGAWLRTVITRICLDVLLARQRRVVSAFLAAARAGDLAGILAVLAPDVVRRADPVALPPGAAVVVRGARQVAEGTAALADRSRLAELALVDGRVGAVVAPHGRLRFAVAFRVRGDLITEYEVIADPARLARLDLALLDRGGSRGGGTAGR